MSEQSDWLTLQDFAALMGISYTTVYNLVREGRLPVPVMRIGRQYRISRMAYRRLVEHQATTFEISLEEQGGGDV